jgi:predicted MFS family arabinose efflux permease
VFAYYGSITVGRMLTGIVVDHWGARRMVLPGLLLAVAGATLFARAETAGLAAGALVLLGLGFAPVYPCLMHEVPRRFAPAAVMTVISRQSGAAYLGGAFVPAAAGWLAQKVSLESVALAVVFGVFALILAVRRLDRLT